MSEENNLHSRHLLEDEIENLADEQSSNEMSMGFALQKERNLQIGDTEQPPQQLSANSGGGNNSIEQLDEYCGLGRSCYDSHNYDRAMSWYRKAAEQGHFLSQLHLAEMYEDGRGVQDDKQAVFWFRKALETAPGSGDAKKGLERLGVDWKSSDAF